MAKLSTGTTIKDTFNNINLMVDDLAPALITDAMPNSKSKASVSGTNSDLINCSGKNNTPACKTMQEIQKSYLKQEVPYKNFEKDIQQVGFSNLSKLSFKNFIADSIFSILLFIHTSLFLACQPYI